MLWDGSLHPWRLGAGRDGLRVVWWPLVFSRGPAGWLCPGQGPRPLEALFLCSHTWCTSPEGSLWRRSSLQAKASDLHL